MTSKWVKSRERVLNLFLKLPTTKVRSRIIRQSGENEEISIGTCMKLCENVFFLAAILFLKETSFVSNE